MYILNTRPVGRYRGKGVTTRDKTSTKTKATQAKRQSLASRARGFVSSRLGLHGTAIAHEDTLVMSPVKLPGADHARKLDEKATSLWRKAKRFFSQLVLTKEDETGYFEPKTWAFWRGIIMYFFLFSVVGHWMEIPYCLSMDALFGIVDADYAIFLDPLYVPYWVYGAGAAAITILLLPLKIRLVGKRKTMWGAALEFFVMAVVLCAALECIMGWIINQPDQFGEYPYWDNSQLPFNILQQAWLVNDIFLGLVTLGYVWFVFPFCQKFCKLIGDKAANGLFWAVIAFFVIICVLSYAL